MVSQQPPLMVQNDMTVWMNSGHPDQVDIRRTLTMFAELMKSPGTWHTYQMTPTSLWNAAAAGLSGEDVLRFLNQYSAYPVPVKTEKKVQQAFDRYGTIKLSSRDGRLFLHSTDTEWLENWLEKPPLAQAFLKRMNSQTIELKPVSRGTVKMELARKGYPVEDHAEHDTGDRLPVDERNDLMRPEIKLRDYQKEAVRAFCQTGAGSGIVVLPCGAGKTFVGLGVLSELVCATLILTSNRLSVEQWKQELLSGTFLTEEQIGEYTGKKKEIKPVTITTYQMMSQKSLRKGSSTAELTPMSLFHHKQWGLIIYDEAHLLPAPIFRMTADIQAKRRLGLTATLIREDGRESDVFSLIGPKWYDKPWRVMEEEGWIAPVSCKEIRIPLTQSVQKSYEEEGARAKFRIAAQNPNKIKVIQKLIMKHRMEPLLIIGQYVEQLKTVAETFQIPLIYGKTPHAERQMLLDAFRSGKIKRLVLSKVANFAVDLPDAAVAIQLSGSFGSRQEEAQRLGRILRPKANRGQAWFYSLISSDTKEQIFASKRKLFLVERGYTYDVEHWRDDNHGSDRTGKEAIAPIAGSLRTVPH